MCVMITEIWTIDGGQKYALLRRANIKKLFDAEYVHKRLLNYFDEI